MASMNWLGFSLSPQELPSQPANQDHSKTAAPHLGFNSDGISGSHIHVSAGECFDLTSDSTTHSLNLPPPFGTFEAFDKNNSPTPQDWSIKGLGSNTKQDNYGSQNLILGTSCSNPNLDCGYNSQQPKLENFLGRHSLGDHDHPTYGSNSASADYMFPSCSLQLPVPAEKSAAGGGGDGGGAGSSSPKSSSSIGLSMIKTWLRNQPPQSDNNNNNNNNNNETFGSGSAASAPAGNSSRTLSLSMSTGSQLSSVLPLLMAKGGGDQSSSSSSNKKQPKTSTTPTALDSQATGGAINTIETAPRKSIDTFGQRTSVYRGVTRHRWTGRYEAHLWDNSCRREGQTRKGRQVYLGGYDKEEKAARAYDLAALKYWGTTTTTNFPISHYEKELEEMKHMTRQEYVASLRRKSSGFSRGASIYRGVTRHHQHGRWQARIGRVAGNKDLYLGTFSTQEEAAEAYDIAAIKFRGLNAVTNFDMSRYDVKSILESSTLPIGGAAKRLKDGEHPDLSVDIGQRSDKDSSMTSHSHSHLTEAGINNFGTTTRHHGWPALHAFHPQPPQPPYSLHMHAQLHNYPYGQRLWCKQEEDSTDASHSHTFQDFHHLQLGNNNNNNTHNFFHSSSGLQSIMCTDSASMDNGSGSNSVIYGGGDGDGNGYGGGGGYVIPMCTTTASFYANDSNQNQRSNGTGFGDNEVKTLGYENVFGSSTSDPHQYHQARNLYHVSQQSSADTVKASACDQGSTACNTWVPTAIPTLAPRPTSMALCPGAPPFTLLHE